MRASPLARRMRRGERAAEEEAETEQARQAEAARNDVAKFSLL